MFRDAHGYVVEAEEVAVGGDDLAGELDGGLLAVADAEQDAEELGVGEGCRSGLEQALARAELRRELLYGVAASFHARDLIGKGGIRLQGASGSLREPSLPGLRGGVPCRAATTAPEPLEPPEEAT